MRLIIKIDTRRAKRRELLILPKGRRSVGVASLRTVKGRKHKANINAGICERTKQSL